MNPPDTARLHVLDGGRIDVLDWSVFDPGAPAGEKRTLADPCYLIRHPGGTLLWDTGVGDDIALEPNGRTVQDVAVFHVETRLAAQLGEIGLRPDDVTHLALSHLHPDHIGNVALFPGATLLIQQDEYESVFGPDADPGAYEALGLETLRNNPLRLLRGDLDVFGDGTTVIKRFPGHTVGSQSLLMRLAGGTVLISGDLAHSTGNWAGRVVPALNVDAGRTRESMRAAAELIVDEHATLWIQHELSQFTTLRRGREHYDLGMHAK